MGTALTCFLVGFLLATAVRGQKGYSLGQGRAVVDSNEQRERWHAPFKTIRITFAGVRPAFIRKGTLLDIDGRETVVPGINAVLNDPEFDGGTAAGSNSGAAPALRLVHPAF